MSLPISIAERLTLPVMVAPMFLVSGVDLAVASCLEGFVGSLTRNHCSSDEEFDGQLATVRAALDRATETEHGRIIGPLAANISIRTDRVTWMNALDSCRRHGVDIIVTASGDPADASRLVHEWGGRIFHDVTSLRFAEKAIAAGVDGLVAIGAGGGGHSGTLSHLVFVPQLRRMFDGVIVMAGAVANGAAVRAAEVLGADLAYMGTRFIAAEESGAPPEYKRMLVGQTPADLVYTASVNGVPAMWLKESLRSHGLDPDNLPVPAGRGIGHLPPGVEPWKNLFSAGQGIGFVEEILPVCEIAQTLRAEYDLACRAPSWRPVSE